MPYHTITKANAIGFIKNFLNDPTLGPIGKNKAIGGVIALPGGSWTLATGWAFWFCWNTEEPEFPPFFLAAETNTYDKNPANMRIISAALKRSHDDYIFRYSSTLPVTTEQVAAFIENAPNWDDDKKEDLEITNFDVGELTANFINHFPNPNTRNVFNDYPYGFFVGGEIDNLINQGTYIRYYFGYNSESDVNTIKIILIPTDEQGNNLTSELYIMLEQSWPPSPVQ